MTFWKEIFRSDITLTVIAERAVARHQLFMSLHTSHADLPEKKKRLIAHYTPLSLETRSGGRRRQREPPRVDEILDYTNASLAGFRQNSDACCPFD
ncbi:hypothetical protein E2C01_029516 [Portunus trituberculatus]|uniref:Uncharacterized protein n=1 Tax=Portunus trituberculatus TaxID=210409 RepID=A0A5B7ESF9_PORTR|nr:hypothetical protein [Portunus trituberculatus]